MNNRIRRGLFSGKYDSTKQRAVLLNGDDRLNNFRSYTATMRLELLIIGRIILSDAQFYDGLYFYWLEKGDLEAFSKLISIEQEDPLFSVKLKCRVTNQSELVQKMFAKQFLFSSIEDDVLLNAIYDFTADYGEKYRNDFRDIKSTSPVLPKPENLDSMKNSLREKLEGMYGSRSGVIQSWNSYIERMDMLFRNTEGKRDLWGYCNEMGLWDKPFLIEECLEQTIANKDSFRAMIEKCIMQAKANLDNTAGDRYIARIIGELNNNLGNRSKIVNALEDLEIFSAIASKKPSNRDGFVKSIHIIRQLINDRYNKTIAYQQGAQFLDMCDYADGLKRFKFEKDYLFKENCDDVQKYNELIKNLAEMSWDDFYNLIESHRAELTTGFEEWMRSYEAGDYNTVKNSIEKYILLCAEIFKPISPKNKINSKLCDPYGICNQYIRDFQNKDYYLVGGGSYEASPPGNEICVLIESEKTSHVLRISKDPSSEEVDLDTLLAPVCNTYNGGIIN